MQSDRTPEAGRPPAPSVSHGSHSVRPMWVLADAGLSVAAYAHLWTEEYRGRTGRGIDESTRCDYRRSLELHVLPTIGPRSLVELAPRDIRTLIVGLETEGQAPASIRKNLAPVRAMLATAVEEGLIAVNPASAVRIAGRRDGYEEREPRILARSEIARFFTALPAEWRPFFELLLHSGVRISEAVGLRWEDVVFGERPHLRIRRQVCRGRVKAPKSRYGRRDIPLSPGMAATLALLRDEADNRGAGGPVFMSATGGCLDVSNVRARVLKPTAERAGIERLGFHTFRHTCASLLFAAGKDLKQVQHWLGHHDPAFTLSTYVHLLDGGLGDADFFDALADAA